MGFFVNLLFLGHAFTIMLVYVWSRHNEHVLMSFFGLFPFHAPYLPWVLFGFSFILGNSILVDLLGIAVGHIYYYLETVCPRRFGFRLLKTPHFLYVIWILLFFLKIPLLLKHRERLFQNYEEEAAYEYADPVVADDRDDQWTKQNKDKPPIDNLASVIIITCIIPD